MSHTTTTNGAQRRPAERTAHPLSPTQGYVLRPPGHDAKQRLCAGAPWPRVRIRGYLRKRRKSLRHLATGRAYRSKPMGDPHAWAFLIAEICLFCFRDCDLLSFRQTEPRVAPFLVISNDVALAAIERMNRIVERRGENYRPTGPAAAGKSLGVTAEECELYELKTLRGIDEAPETPKARRQQEDRERKRAKRSEASAAAKAEERERGRRRRAAKGARPHAESLSQRQPWKLEGVSRSKWYARQRTKTSTSASWTDSSVRSILKNSVSCGRTKLSKREQHGPAYAAGARARDAERKNGVAVNERKGVAVKKTGRAERDLPLRPDGTVSDEWVAGAPPLLFDGAENVLVTIRAERAARAAEHWRH